MLFHVDYLGSRPGHAFWMQLLEDIAERVENAKCLNRDACTGIIVFNESLQKYLELAKDVTILEADMFSPSLPKWILSQIKRICQNAQGISAEGCQGLEDYLPSMKEPAVAIRHGYSPRAKVVNTANIVEIVPPARLERRIQYNGLGGILKHKMYKETYVFYMLILPLLCEQESGKSCEQEL
jgi:hypothetical protein